MLGESFFLLPFPPLPLPPPNTLEQPLGSLVVFKDKDKYGCFTQWH